MAGRFRVEPCACGGWIVADPQDPRWQTVARAIREHQRTERHQEWRRLGGLDFDAETMGPVAA